MPRLVLLACLTVFGWFNYAQYSGWSLFADDVNAPASKSFNAARAFHK